MPFTLAMASACIITATPDVSGTGVRLSVYLQSLLCLVPLILVALNKRTLLEGLNLSERLTTTNLILAFAVLVSSIFQALGNGLSSYHAHVAMKLSWLNISNVLVFYWMYAEYKARHSSPEYKRSRRPSGFLEAGPIEAVVTAREASTGPFKRVLVLAGAALMSLVGIFGVWLWQEPGNFGPVSALCATDVVVIVMPLLGNLRMALGSGSLRACYLVLYGVFLAIGVPSLVVGTLSPGCLGVSANRGPRSSSKYPKALIWLFILNLATILEIEFTLRENAHLQVGDMTSWNFGQVLAVVLVMVPARDALRAISAARAWAPSTHEDGDATMLPRNSAEKIDISNNDFKEVWPGKA
ncbi:hypothetical protein BKA70DRAFT_551390 [Coprinopsis sp. MPI-PUGE-AT-0042]|nr:hypothetical protein BKA70DRAFT_551390 [Coprinopsis sp. MPI-PUGE-AT-0042]